MVIRFAYHRYNLFFMFFIGFFFNDTATTEIYTLSLHDALPISSTPSRVFKGMKMSGRMGKDKKTILNLEVIKVIESENLLLVKGSVPGFKGSLVKVRSTNRG